MKSKLKLPSLLLSALITASALAGCYANTGDGDNSKIGYTSSGSAAEYAGWLANRLSSDTEEVWEADEISKSGILSSSGAEIIIGTAEEAENLGLDVSGLSDEGFIIRRAEAGGSALILAKTDDGLDRGVRYYANYCDKSAVLNITKGEGFRVGSITIAGADLSEYVIELTDSSDECMIYAADELRRYLGDACGVYPEIVDKAEDGAYAITLVKDASPDMILGDEAFTIKSHDKGVTITGGRYRGCMYGVYTFLEDYIGYRFYYATAENSQDVDNSSAYLYEKDAVVIEADSIDIEEHPSITERDTYGSPILSSPALKYNGEKTQNNAKYGGYGRVAKACHGYATFISDRELEDMGYSAGHKYSINPCYTDEYLNNLLVSRVISKLDTQVENGAVPGKTVTAVDIAQHDIGNFCMCDNCMEVYQEDAAISGATVRLANFVAEALEEKYPEIYVSILAYYGTDTPPKVTKPHEMVQISYCFYISGSEDMICSNHSISGEECENNKLFADTFDKWAEITDNMYVWYYPMTSYYMVNSAPNTFEIYDDIKYLAEKNIYGLFALFDAHDYDFGLISWYMVQRMSWDADITYDEYTEMLKEYIFLVYGDGYEAVYEYMEIMEKCGDLSGHWCGFHSAPMQRIDLSYYKQNLSRSKELYEIARKYARTSGQEQMVDKLFAHMHYLELAVMHSDMWVSGSEEQRAEYKNMVYS